MSKQIFLALLLFAVKAVAAQPLIKQGIWRATLSRPDGVEIAFNFEAQLRNGRQVLYVMNAGERLLADSIQQKGDSLYIQMPFFASGFAARLKGPHIITGTYLKKYADSVQAMPFTAVYGVKYRYAAGLKPLYNVSGRWAVNFGTEKNDASMAVGEFMQQPNGTVTGTFLTPYGDYRYLQGIVTADTLKLSAFDGGHALVFIAQLKDADHINTAYLYSGKSGTEEWQATRDENAALPDENTFTKLRSGESRLNFSFPSTEGKMISINDAAYNNKVVVVQLLGSWCPNCMDETAFLSDYYRKNHSRGFEVIGLAYERTGNFEASKKALQPFIKRFSLPYPVLITGVAVSDSLKTEKTLPQVESIRAFPTYFVIDKKGVVRNIHSGFNGPGTGTHYAQFKQEFEQLINELLNE